MIKRIFPITSCLKLFLCLLIVTMWVLVGWKCLAFQKTDSVELQQNEIGLGMYSSPLNLKCFNRGGSHPTLFVDAHLHPKPFGLDALSLTQILSFARKEGVVFVNLFGIGQILSRTGVCGYYLKCSDEKVRPSVVNDIRNAEDLHAIELDGMHVTLSYSYIDLAQPGINASNMLKDMGTLDHAYPDLFHWAGETNLVKQALFDNGQPAIELGAIPQWAPFMDVLKERGIPFTIHSDIGNDVEEEKYLGLMQRVVELYPDNKIVWAHMGLSKEQKDLSPEHHIKILKSMFDDNIVNAFMFNLEYSVRKSLGVLIG